MIFTKKHLLSKQFVSIRNPPFNLKESDSNIFAHEFEKTIPLNHVLKLKNVHVVEETLFYNMCVLGKYTHTFKLDWQYKTKIILKRFLLKQIKIEKAIWITDDLSAGYFHWILDCLPRLLNVSKVDDSYHTVIILRPEVASQNFVRETLDLLGYTYLIKEDKKINLKCQKLIVANHCANTSGNYNDQVIKELRSIFIKKINVQKNPIKKWVYISREKANRRKATNESELIDMLLALNIEVHYFEEYNFLKQMDIITHTDFLISIHGASLTNMLFMEKDTHVIELRNEIDTHSNCYFSLASALNINYHYILNSGDHNNIPHFADLTIDIERLKNYILSLKRMS